MSDLDLDLDDRRFAKLPRVLGPIDAFCVVVGCTIGSGIFLVPAKIAQDVPFISGIILVWVIGGILSGAGALTLAELGAMMPQAGGLYVYLRAAYGPLVAFLFGWVEFLVVRSGSMATLAAAFARYFVQLCPPALSIRGEVWQAGAAVLAIAVVTTVNVLGTRRGGTLQVVGTVLKVGGVAVLMALPFLLGAGTLANLTPFWPGGNAAGSIFTGMMAAMVSVLWAYDGWTNVTPLAEEIREPGRNVPRALLFGMVVLIAAYVGMTLAYHYVLPMPEIASASRDSGHVEKATAAVYCKHLLGGPGVVAISLLVMCSTFISLNGNALTGPRAYFAMARDRLFPSTLCRVHPRYQTPANAILSQGIWAILLTVAGTFLIVVPPPGCDLRLLSSVKDVSDIPTGGKDLIIVAAVDNMLHFRVFDGDGKSVVDTDEKRLTEQTRQIDNLKKQLVVLWPPHELTGSEKGLVISAVTSVVGHTPPSDSGAGLLAPILTAWKRLNETPLYDLLYTYVIFGANLFYMLAISSVFVLRIRQPDLPRPYRTLGYPVTPLLYVAGVLVLLYSMLADHASRVQSLVGIGIILLGLPAYWLFRRGNKVSLRG